uniref:C2H2-type domain-containing protein n=1 Tax=Pygocentrus nattereri TaxID=42514 RepID=A0AAR2L1H0_PYGNA
MEWRCKLCAFGTSSNTGLLKHYRLKHRHFGHEHFLPCIYLNCSCSFKTWGGLRTHLCRAHKSEQSENKGAVTVFKCKICNTCFPNTKDYFQHINSHLKRLETIVCVFDGCDFKTNIYATYATHKSRKHQFYSCDDFKADVIVKHPTATSFQHIQSHSSSLESNDDVEFDTVDLDCEGNVSAFLEVIGSLLLKLESIYNVTGKCLDDLVEQLQFICTLSSQHIPNLVRSILTQNNCTVDENVICELVEKLHKTVKDTFQIHEEFILHYFDEDFGDFFTIHSTSDVKHKGSIKVVIIPSVVLTLAIPETDSVTDADNVRDTPSVTSQMSSEPSTSEDSRPDGTSSASSQDTILLSPQKELWPKEIKIPLFTVATEAVLRSANEQFLKDGTVLNNTRVRSEIMEKLADYMYSYTAYPTGLQVGEVAKALVKKHPCLIEPGSRNGWIGWMYSLKYKMGNYRSKLRNLGFPEVACNSLNNKRPGERKPAQNVKKARKGEVKYLPHYPSGENGEHQEQQRLKILSEIKKRERTTINQLMSKTFAHRRQDVVTLQLSVKEIKDRWPALLDVSQVRKTIFLQHSLKPITPHM